MRYYDVTMTWRTRILVPDATGDNSESIKTSASGVLEQEMQETLGYLRTARYEIQEVY